MSGSGLTDIGNDLQVRRSSSLVVTIVVVYSVVTDLTSRLRDHPPTNVAWGRWYLLRRKTEITLSVSPIPKRKGRNVTKRVLTGTYRSKTKKERSKSPTSKSNNLTL